MTVPTHLPSLHVAASSSFEARELRLQRGLAAEVSVGATGTRCPVDGPGTTHLTRIHEPASVAGVHDKGSTCLLAV
jgi:hypothetical protein